VGNGAGGRVAAGCSGAVDLTPRRKTSGAPDEPDEPIRRMSRLPVSVTVPGPSPYGARPMTLYLVVFQPPFREAVSVIGRPVGNPLTSTGTINGIVMSGSWTDPKLGKGTFVFTLHADGDSIDVKVTNSSGKSASYTSPCERGL